MRLFHCIQDTHFDDFNSDAAVFMDTYWPDGKYEDVPIDTPEQWLDAVHAIVPKEEILPERLVTNMDLGFDLDDEPCRLDYDARDIIEDGLATMGFKYPSVSLFGEPRCQQTPKRFLDPMWRKDIRRMNPLFNYSGDARNPEEDQAVQLYASLSSMRMRPSGQGKMDISCT